MSGTIRQHLHAAAVFLGLCLASAALAGTTSWKEEVRLSDGSALIVERSMSTDFFGKRELGQPSPRSEETLSFTMPGTDQRVEWRSDYGRGYEDNLTLLYVGIWNGSAYIATRTGHCHAYNKWGRPNPPYVFFRYDGSAWQRVSNEEFPAEVRKPNVLVGGYDHRRLTAGDRLAFHIPAEAVERANGEVGRQNAAFREIRREPSPRGSGGCPEMVPDGRGGWLGIDWFTDKPTIEACKGMCKLQRVEPDFCPCDRIFKGR